jgi:putative Mg2+ transporter-C (MgtC) family protein
MITEIHIPLFTPAVEMNILDIIFRLLCALIVGIVIGTEREYTHRPAGMRTHMLVALGACVVMVIGQLIFEQYQSYGATPDPARMAAQVITGVGFLGAGTIMKEGPSVKGLTTAASLWATACLGLAAGAGYYVVALAGMVFIFATLTIFEVIQNKLIPSEHTTESYCVHTSDISTCLTAINQFAEKTRATVSGIQVQRDETDQTYSVTFRIDFSGSKATKQKQTFMENILSTRGTLSVKTISEFAEKL